MFKEVFVEHLEELLPQGSARVLEVGSGHSTAVVDLLKRRKEIAYRGVEPSEAAHKFARDLLKDVPNAELVHGFGYDLGEASSWDLCFSLSVLEHVKQLDTFLSETVRVVKKGGWIVHRWDVGHAVTPVSHKERLQVFLGNHAPGMLSEHKFVRHLHLQKVISMLEKHGADVKRVTFHQMPEHKALIKRIGLDSAEKVMLAREIAEWEFKVSPLVRDLPEKTREQLFPAIAVWAQKCG